MFNDKLFVSVKWQANVNFEKNKKTEIAARIILFFCCYTLIETKGFFLQFSFKCCDLEINIMMRLKLYCVRDFYIKFFLNKINGITSGNNVRRVDENPH